MKQILLMIAVVALVGCGKKPAEGSFAETKAKAEAGDAEAQIDLGVMYEYGEGVEQDFKEAVKWYRKAAEQGDVNAQYNLGSRYYIGEGVPQDYVTAYAWYNIAAAKGDAQAVTWKDNIAKQLTPAQIAKAEELVKEMVEKNPKLLNK